MAQHHLWGSEFGDLGSEAVRLHSTRLIINGVETTFTAGFAVLRQNGGTVYAPFVESGVDSEFDSRSMTSSMANDDGVVSVSDDPLAAGWLAMWMAYDVISAFGADFTGGIRVPVNLN